VWIPWPDSPRQAAQALELLLQRLEFLPRLSELSLGGQALVVREVAGGFPDQLVLIGRSSGSP